MLQNRRNWSQFEDKAIISLVKKHGTKNWAEISEKMASKYGIETRSGKQCRERWHNHLNPAVNKGAWTPKEEETMFQAHQKHGNRWTQIAKLFAGRTDNDIKNHFYSMLRRSLRRVNKLLGLRNSTQKIRLIKPSVLSNIFSNSNEAHAEDWKQISQALFQFSRVRSAEQLASGLEEAEKKRLEELIEKIASYNQEYELSQLERKESKKSEKELGREKNEVVAEEADRESESDAGEEEQDQVPEPPPIKKKSSSNKIVLLQTQKKSKTKTKQIRRKIPTIKKKSSRLSSKAKKAKLHKKDEKGEQPQSGNPSSATTNPPISELPNTRLRRRQSDLSLKFVDQLALESLELPELADFSRKRSSMVDSRRVGSSSSSSFFNVASPHMDLRIFTRTPQGPTPNFADGFFRNYINIDWKANNEELDSIVNQTRRSIERRTALNQL